jgi:hypothetical protein
VRILLHITVILSLCLASCSGTDSGNETADIPDKFRWIEGKFIYVHEQSGYYFEEWRKQDDNTYLGEGFFLTRDCVDTIFSIKMRLIHEPEKTTLFYDMKDQKDSKETEFTLTKNDGPMYVFENPFRDFPSIMQYKLIGDSIIEVVERGFANNKEKVVEYTAKKID